MWNATILSNHQRIATLFLYLPANLFLIYKKSFD